MLELIQITLYFDPPLVLEAALKSLMMTLSTPLFVQHVDVSNAATGIEITFALLHSKKVSHVIKLIYHLYKIRQKAILLNVP